MPQGTPDCFVRGALAVELDLGAMYGWIVSELGRRRPVAQSMAGLIDQCEAGRPHADWARLRALPYDELSPLVEWLEKPFRQERPPVPLKGLWFGLFNPCPDGRTPVADIYVCGSRRFNPDLNDNDWAVNPDWWPEARYASSSVLAGIYRIAYRQGECAQEQKGCLGNDAEYPVCLGYAAFAVRELLERLDRSLVLGQSRSLGIGVGFDDGDFVPLGELSRDGLKPIELDAGPQERPFAPVLEDLRSADPRTVIFAAAGLKRFGESAREALPELLKLASTNRESGLRQCALAALAVVAPDDPRAKAAIFQALRDKNAFVRRDALQATISIRNLSASDLARIKEMENDPDEFVREWSEIALRNIRLRGEGGG
jgi:hypothetical protein